MSTQDSRRLSSHAMGAIALLDQAVVSGSNFLVVVSVGRLSGLSQLGQFSLAMSLAVLAMTTIRSLLVTPYTVFSRRLPPAEQCRLRGSTLHQFGVCLAGLIAIGALITACFAYFAPHFVNIVLATGVAAIGLSTREFVRRMAYADLRFADALGVDTASSILLFAWLVIALTSLDAGTALLATGVSGVLPSVILLILHRNKFHFDRDQIRTDRQVSWRFGRWVALSQMTHTAQGYVVHWILAAVGGTTATGIYSACWSIVQLASPFVQGVGNAAGPLISRAFAEGGIQRTQSAVRRTTRLLALSLASHAIVMLAIGDFLQRWLYGQQYAVPSLLPGVLAMAMGAASVGVGWSKGVSVMEKPYWNTWLNLMGLILTCTSVTVFTVLGGVAGAAWAFLFSSIITSAARWSCYSRLIANHRSEADFSSSSAPVAEVA